MKKITTTIEVTVLTKTKKSLEENSKYLGISIGEVLDRVMLKITCNDPGIASVMLGDYFVITTRTQTEEQMRETCIRFMVFLFRSYRQEGIKEEDLLNEIVTRLHEVEAEMYKGDTPIAFS